MGKTKEQSIVISALKTDIPPIMGGLGQGKGSFTHITDILTPEMCNTHDDMRGVFTISSKSLHYHRIKLQAGINREFEMNM